MKKHVAKEWVNALRSGEYVQTFGYERWQPEDKDGRLERVRYDALGVLGDLCEADLEDEEIFREYEWQREEGIVGHIVNHEAMQKWAGMKKGWAQGEGEDGELIEQVIELNDSGKTFGEIAAFLEKYFGLEPGDAGI